MGHAFGRPRKVPPYFLLENAVNLNISYINATTKTLKVYRYIVSHYLIFSLKAFIIGWTSDFVPKLVYTYTESPDRTLTNYVNHSLSFFDVHDFQNRSKPDDPKIDDFGIVTMCR